MSDAVRKFIENKVGEVIKKTLNDGTVLNINDPTRLTNVRFSSFPFCGVKWFLDLPSLVSPRVRKDYAFGYFTSVGTTVHEVTQEALHSLADIFEGDDIEVLWDWKCKSCKHREGILVPQAPEGPCSKCGGTTGYSREEHQVRHRNTKLDKEAVGHTDTILRIKLSPALERLTGSKYGVIIADYKTSSVYNVSKKDALPYPNNVAQISKYAGALQKTLPVIGWALIYMPRDVPFRYKICVGYVSQEDCVKHRKDINKYIRLHTQWSQASTWEDFSALYERRPCQSLSDIPEEFKDCDHQKNCCSSRGINNLKLTYNKLKKVIPIMKVTDE